MLRGLLAAEGIDSRVFNENAQSVVGEIPFTHAYPEIWLLHRQDERKARAVLAKAERPVAGECFCRTCGEPNPSNFEVCWYCAREI